MKLKSLISHDLCTVHEIQSYNDDKWSVLMSLCPVTPHDGLEAKMSLFQGSWKESLCRVFPMEINHMIKWSWNDTIDVIPVFLSSEWSWKESVSMKCVALWSMILKEVKKSTICWMVFKGNWIKPWGLSSMENVGYCIIQCDGLERSSLTWRM